MHFAVAPTWIQLGLELQAAITTYIIYVVGAVIVGYLIYKDRKEKKSGSKLK